MKDNFGDKIEVEVTGALVELRVQDTSHLQDNEVTAQADLTAAKARKLARKLKAAADEIDPRPVAESSAVAKDEPLKVGDRVKRVGPHYLDNESTRDFGDRECELGDLGTVKGTGFHAPITSSVLVAFDGRESAQSVIARSSLELVVPKTYSLTLTQEQAETLAVILGNVGGPHGRFDYAGRDSARTHASDVGDMLAALGVDAAGLDGRPEYALDEAAGKREPNSIYFASRS